MADIGTYKIYSNVSKNRLYIILRGFLPDATLDVASQEVIKEINKLNPGCDVITDISTFKPATSHGADQIKKTQQHLAAHKPKRVIRVVGTEALAEMQMARLSKEAGYVADAATTVADAEKLLGD
jgi:hypothetical protein